MDGLVTGAAAILTYLAFDDITTDNATSFKVEYACLLLCAGWTVILIGRLARRGRSILAAVCTALLLGILWGQREIGPGTRASWQLEYVIASVALVGMLFVKCYLVFRGARPSRVVLP